MSDTHISNVTQFQNSNDDRPLPERIATLYSFTLAFQDVEGNKRYYSVQDWIAGILPKSNTRNLWNMMKRRHPQLYTRCVQLPYKVANGRKYQMDHADALTLYSITQRMEANSGSRDSVLVYLAKAGVILDELMRNPAQAEAMFSDLSDEKDFRKLLNEGYSPQEARQWIQVRQSLKEEWKRIRAEWNSRGIAEKLEYARLTNNVSEVAIGKTATSAKRSMKITGTPRDYHSAADNAAIEIVSTTSRLLHRQRDSQGVEELSEDVKDVKPIIEAARSEIEKVFSKKPRRLPPKND